MVTDCGHRIVSVVELIVRRFVRDVLRALGFQGRGPALQLNGRLNLASGIFRQITGLNILRFDSAGLLVRAAADGIRDCRIDKALGLNRKIFGEVTCKVSFTCDFDRRFALVRIPCIGNRVVLALYQGIPALVLDYDLVGIVLVRFNRRAIVIRLVRNRINREIVIIRERERRYHEGRCRLSRIVVDAVGCYGRHSLIFIILICNIIIRIRILGCNFIRFGRRQFRGGQVRCRKLRPIIFHMITAIVEFDTGAGNRISLGLRSRVNGKTGQSFGRDCIGDRDVGLTRKAVHAANCQGRCTGLL